MEPMNFNEAVKIFWDKLGVSAIMQLASSLNDYPTIRTISCLVYDEKILFKTDVNFEKTKQLMENPRVAVCKYNVTVEGPLANLGLVVDEPELKFQKLYKKYLDGSYNAYSHEDTEILLAIDPELVKIWDTDENNYGFQIYINFKEKTAFKKIYDVYK